MVQRKYKIIKDSLLKGLTEEVNEQIQREYKDKEGFLYQSSGRWQCLGAPFLKTVYGIRLWSSCNRRMSRCIILPFGTLGYIKLGYLCKKCV